MPLLDPRLLKSLTDTANHTMNTVGSVLDSHGPSLTQDQLEDLVCDFHILRTYLAAADRQVSKLLEAFKDQPEKGTFTCRGCQNKGFTVTGHPCSCVFGEAVAVWSRSKTR